MIARGKKTVSFLLMLALLLAPLELVFAHQGDGAGSSAVQALSCRTSHAAALDRHVISMDDQGGQCDGHGAGLCKHCVYCSPALSTATTLDIIQPSVTPSTTVVVSGYSIDLPTDIRPPRQL